MLFDKSIPERSADYYRELDEATVKVDPQERHVSDFDWLVDQHHMEDGLLYKTTRVVVRKGLIVGFRALITAGRQQIEDKTPVLHVADLQSMTEEFSRRLRLKPASHDGDEGGGVTVGKEVTPLEPEPDTSSRKGVPSCTESASVSASGTSKRVRTQRVLTNVSALGEIHSVDVDGASSFCDDVDSIFMTDAAQYREPETYQESLDCAEPH